MIITYPRIKPDGATITKSILDNKILLYSVIVHDEHVLAEGRLVSIRQMLDAFKDDPPETVDELVRRYGAEGHAFRSPDGIEDRELMEAVFDQHSAANRAVRLTDIFNEYEGPVRTVASMGGTIVDTFMEKLPESTPYADELVFV
jgi:hypothetical protein